MRFLNRPVCSFPSAGGSRDALICIVPHICTFVSYQRLPAASALHAGSFLRLQTQTGWKSWPLPARVSADFGFGFWEPPAGFLLLPRLVFRRSCRFSAPPCRFVLFLVLVLPKCVPFWNAVHKGRYQEMIRFAWNNASFYFCL